MTYHFTHWPIAAIVVFTAGCQPMDAIEGKPSAFQAEVERRALITLPDPVADPTSLADGVVPLTVVVPEPAALPVAAPPCHEVVMGGLH